MPDASQYSELDWEQLLDRLEASVTPVMVEMIAEGRAMSGVPRLLDPDSCIRMKSREKQP